MSAAAIAAAAIVWKEKYNDFKRCVEMPERGTPLHTWQQNQLSSGSKGLNSKIRKENEENEGSTWSKWREKLCDCIEQKICAKIGNAWEEKYDESKRCVEMPERGTPLHTWLHNQSRNGSKGLNDKIRNENEGSTWSEQRETLANCVAQKRHEKDTRLALADVTATRS